MALDRALRNGEPLGDLQIGESLTECVEDVPFALADARPGKNAYGRLTTSSRSRLEQSRTDEYARILGSVEVA